MGLVNVELRKIFADRSMVGDQPNHAGGTGGTLLEEREPSAAIDVRWLYWSAVQLPEHKKVMPPITGVLELMNPGLPCFVCSVLAEAIKRCLELSSADWGHVVTIVVSCLMEGPFKS